jgi:uncharacterized protein (UPF0332 family)
MAQEKTILESTSYYFEKELARLPPEFKKHLEAKKKTIDSFLKLLDKKAGAKNMGLYVTPEIIVKNGVPQPNFEKLTLHFLLDDFERPIPQFDAKLLFADDFAKVLKEERKKNQYNEEEIFYTLKDEPSVSFIGTGISIVRENCFDGIYDDLKSLGSSLVIYDSRGFISALKTIDIHRNMLLQKFEKYVVVYAGAGSWLRGEKSNDFDVFIVIDDTDVKRMPRYQVKDQLSKIIWQMSREVSALTGIQIHIQVYLLTDFWDALKDAHPVMFTFLRDGVPFYDRGIYSAWKELLKLGKIRPSAEAIDMHMNVGTQLLDRAKKMFADIVINDVYNSVLSPSQAVLMLKGYNPTTPKETVRMFKEVLLEKEKCVTNQDVETLEHTVKMFKEIEHNKDAEVKGKDVDKMIADAEKYLKNIKKLFEEISEARTKDSILSSYQEIINQMRSLPGFSETSEKALFVQFEKEYVKSGKLPAFVKESLSSFLKAKEDYEKGNVTTTEVNKVLKEARNIMTEIKHFKDTHLAQDLNSKKLKFTYAQSESGEVFMYDKKVYLLLSNSEKVYELSKDTFKEVSIKRESFSEPSKLGSLSLSTTLLDAIKKFLKTEEIFL